MRAGGGESGGAGTTRSQAAHAGLQEEEEEGWPIHVCVCEGRASVCRSPITPEVLLSASLYTL